MSDGPKIDNPSPARELPKNGKRIKARGRLVLLSSIIFISGALCYFDKLTGDNLMILYTAIVAIYKAQDDNKEPEKETP